MIRRALACSLLAGLLPATGHAVGTAFTYQGYLSESGAPASGVVDLRFTLQDAMGQPLGMIVEAADVAVDGGVFSVQLDFGPVFDGGNRTLAVAVRPGASTGAYTPLTPAVPIRATPYAQHAEAADVALTVAADGVDGGSISDGSIQADDIDTTQVQRRVNNACMPGSAIRSIGSDGTITCEPDDVGAGDVTGVTTDAMSGLAGGGTAGDLSLSIAPSAIGSARIADGSIAAVDVDSSQVQLRVSGACMPGSTIQAIAANGGITCAAGAVDSYSFAVPGAQVTNGPADSCETITMAQSQFADGASLTLPAGTYFTLMPTSASFQLTGGLVNMVNVQSTGTVETYLMRDPMTIMAQGRISYGSGTPSGDTSSEQHSVDSVASTFTLAQPTTLFVRAVARLSQCGTVTATSGRTLRVLRLR